MPQCCGRDPTNLWLFNLRVTLRDLKPFGSVLHVIWWCPELLAQAPPTPTFWEVFPRIPQCMKWMFNPL